MFSLSNRFKQNRGEQESDYLSVTEGKYMELNLCDLYT